MSWERVIACNTHLLDFFVHFLLIFLLWKHHVLLNINGSHSCIRGNRKFSAVRGSLLTVHPEMDKKSSIRRYIFSSSNSQQGTGYIAIIKPKWKSLQKAREENDQPQFCWKDVFSRYPEETAWSLMQSITWEKLMTREQNLREGLAQQKRCRKVKSLGLHCFILNTWKVWIFFIQRVTCFNFCFNESKH